MNEVDKRRLSNFGTFNDRSKEIKKLKLTQNYNQSYSKQKNVTYTIIPKKGRSSSEKVNLQIEKIWKNRKK